jgi:hypothetical protein
MLRRIGNLPAGLVMLFITTALLGCSRESPEQKKVVIDIQQPDKYEITGSGTVRSVRKGSDAMTLVEKHTPYQDGTSGHVYYRSTDKTLRLAVEEYKDGTRKSTANYDEDGKTLINGEVYRPDGSLYLTMERQKSGQYRILLFAQGGKYNWLVRETQSGGVVEDTYLRKDRTTWAKVRGKPSNGIGRWMSEEWIDIYRENQSSRLLRQESQNNGTLITYFNAYSGNPEYKQLWGYGYDNTNFNNQLIAGLDELDWQGKVSRGFVFKEEAGVIKLQEVKTPVQIGSWPAVSTELHTKKYRTDETLENLPIVEEWADDRSWIPAKDKKPLRRLLHLGTLAEVVGPNGVVSKHDATENKREEVDLKKLRRPQVDSFNQARGQLWSENTNFLGHRDDTDPCRWYHR